jgi:hypothetical protein
LFFSNLRSTLYEEGVVSPFQRWLVDSQPATRSRSKTDMETLRMLGERLKNVTPIFFREEEYFIV